VVVGTLKHRSYFQRSDVTFDLVDLGKPLRLEIIIGLGLEECSQLSELGRFFVQFRPGIDPALQEIRLGDDLARAILIIPEAGTGHLLVELLNSGALHYNVKDTP